MIYIIAFLYVQGAWTTGLAVLDQGWSGWMFTFTVALWPLTSVFSLVTHVVYRVRRGRWWM